MRERQADLLGQQRGSTGHRMLVELVDEVVQLLTGHAHRPSLWLSHGRDRNAAGFCDAVTGPAPGDVGGEAAPDLVQTDL